MLNYMAISFIWQWKFHRKSLLVLVRSCFLMVKTEGFVHPYRNVKTASKRSKFALAKAVGVLLLISTETGFRLNDFPGMCCGLVDYTWPYYVVRSITQHNLVLSRVGYFVLSKQSFKRFLCHETLRFFIMETKNEKKKKSSLFKPRQHFQCILVYWTDQADRFFKSVQLYSAFPTAALSIMKVFYSGDPCCLSTKLQVPLGQTIFPAMGKFPLQAGLMLTHRRQWTPEPNTTDYKEIWSCIHIHIVNITGEHRPATHKLQHSPHHLEM